MRNFVQMYSFWILDFNADAVRDHSVGVCGGKSCHVPCFVVCYIISFDLIWSSQYSICSYWPGNWHPPDLPRGYCPDHPTSLPPTSWNPSLWYFGLIHSHPSNTRSTNSSGCHILVISLPSSVRGRKVGTRVWTHSWESDHFPVQDWLPLGKAGF